VQQLVLAVAYLHSIGIVHRYVSAAVDVPLNISCSPPFSPHSTGISRWIIFSSMQIWT
jgi:serine/threonine protein kinase